MVSVVFSLTDICIEVSESKFTDYKVIAADNACSCLEFSGCTRVAVISEHPG